MCYSFGNTSVWGLASRNLLWLVGGCSAAAFACRSDVHFVCTYVGKILRMLILSRERVTFVYISSNIWNCYLKISWANKVRDLQVSNPMSPFWFKVSPFGCVCDIGAILQALRTVKGSCGYLVAACRVRGDHALQTGRVFPRRAMLNGSVLSAGSVTKPATM